MSPRTMALLIKSSSSKPEQRELLPLNATCNLEDFAVCFDVLKQNKKVFLAFSNQVSGYFFFSPFSPHLFLWGEGAAALKSCTVIRKFLLFSDFRKQLVENPFLPRFFFHRLSYKGDLCKLSFHTQHPSML